MSREEGRSADTTMGIDVQLRTESGEVLRAIPDSDMVLSRAQSQLADTCLLKYLDPWGDAVFNQAQAADLSDDIAAVRRLQADSPLGVRLGEVQSLVDRLSAETHLYLWFVGD